MCVHAGVRVLRRRDRLDGALGILSRQANDVDAGRDEVGRDETERHESDDRAKHLRSPAAETPEDRGDPGRQEHEQGHEQEAQEPRDGIRSRDPEDENGRDRTRGEHERGVAIAEEWARGEEEERRADERQPARAREQHDPVDPDEGGDEDLVDRRRDQPGELHLHAVGLARAFEEVVDVRRVPRGDQGDRGCRAEGCSARAARAGSGAPRRPRRTRPRSSEGCTSRRPRPHRAPRAAARLPGRVARGRTRPGRSWPRTRARSRVPGA